MPNPEKTMMFAVAEVMLLSVCLQAEIVPVAEHTLFSLEGKKPAEGWWLNIWGKNPKGEKGAGRIEIATGRQGGSALRLVTEEAGSHNFVSPVLPDGPWRNYEYGAVTVWYRGDGTKRKVRLQLHTNESGRDCSYTGTLFLGSKEWQRAVLKSFWRRDGTPDLNLAKLSRVYFNLPLSGEITVGSIGLESKGRRIFVEREQRPTLVLPELSSEPKPDGRLDDPVWNEAAKIDGLHVFGLSRTPAKYQTTAWAGQRGSKLYLAARLKGEKPDEIPANWREFDTTIWKDSCLEFYLDPGDSNREGFQFIVNSVGARQDIGRGLKGWNGDWSAKAALDEKDGWMVELVCDTKSLGLEPKPGDVWGFNLKRHVVSAQGKYLEVSGWSQGTPQPVSGYGTLIFGPRSQVKDKVESPDLRELLDGTRLCRLVVRSEPKETEDIHIQEAVWSPGASERWVFEAKCGRAPGKDSVANLPLVFDLKRDGRHLFAVTARDTNGLVIHHSEHSFHLSKVTPYEESDIVLWPPPQEWRLHDGFWKLPEAPTLALKGEGDRFPAEHLRDKLHLRYGAHTHRVAGDDADLVLIYEKQGTKPEGFELTVTQDAVRLRAQDGRGMYYGVRAFLDLMQQSGNVGSEPQARCVECRDWPAIPRRVFYHRMDDFGRAGKGVQTYKDLIYDQVAGGRYNLLILNMRSGMMYDSHPEIANGRWYSKKEMKEILDFARRHYLDVAPGGNSPGHGNWLTGRHPELQEDGDRNTLCVRHPKALPLLYDLYGELIDLFQPTEYFHLGGDEVRWKTAAVPEEKRCKICKGHDKKELLLKHWTRLADFCRERKVRPILWGDMLSEKWNGGGLYQTATILPRLPRNLIISAWGTGEMELPGATLRKMGFTPWTITTGFGGSKMERHLGWIKDQDAAGIAQFTRWPWSNFAHHNYRKLLNYTAPAIHCNAACAWKPEISTVGWDRLVATQGRHWMKVMQVSEWGTRKISFQPLPIDKACNDSTRDEVAGDGQGWLDLGPDRDLSSMRDEALAAGATPFSRPKGSANCIILRGNAEAAPIAVGKAVRGLVFLHTAAASDEEIAKLYHRFFRKNTSQYGMNVAFYRVRYADGRIVSVPVKIGWNVHLWDCHPPARVMPGARSFWLGFTAERRRKDPNAPDACAWSMEWKNPHPSVPIEYVTFAAAGTEATVALLGLTAVQ